MVGGLEHVLFVHILGIILPTDFHIFQRGRYTTNQCLISCLRTWWFPGVQEAQESAGTATQLNGMWICRYSDRMFQDVVLMKLGCSCLMYDWGVGKGLKTPSKSYSWATFQFWSFRCSTGTLSPLSPTESIILAICIHEPPNETS